MLCNYSLIVMIVHYTVLWMLLYRLSNIDYQISTVKYQISTIKYQISNIKYQISNIEYRIDYGTLNLCIVIILYKV
jgi:hypothetical protein